jgi:hypothetical protein
MNRKKTMSRYKAAAIHVSISATIATLIFLPIYFFWYPGDLFDSAGGRDLFLIMLGVDVTVGPLITLIVFVQGKKGLTFDLWAIGVTQAAFLAYGVFTLAESRPVYIAFVKDRFELVRANEIPDSVLGQAHMNRYRDLPWSGPRLVGVRFPSDPDEKFRIMISGMAGVDIQAYPQYHVPYDTERKDVLAKAAPVAGLTKFNKGLDVAAMARRVGRAESGVRFLPLRAGKKDLTVLLDAKDADILRIAAIKPWEYE